MLIQHEHQHNETMLQTLQLAEPGVFAPARAPSPRRRRAAGSVAVDGGPFAIGDAGEGFAYDNERPRHEVELAAFRIDRAPVTNAPYLRVRRGRRLPAPRAVVGGRAGRCATREGWERPLYWTADGARAALRPRRGARAATCR